MDELEDLGTEHFIGIPLLEVFSIRISDDKDFDSERRSELYGTVRVTDERGTKALLFDHDFENSESINQNETLILRGPPRCISASTAFTIDLNLKDKNRDLEINNGKIRWDKRNAFLYDKFMAINVPGRIGFATVNCAVFSVATEAKVKIELIRKDQLDGSSDTLVDNEFYGTIVAYYGQVFDYSRSDQKKYFRSTLFNRSAGNCVKLEPGKPIPLLKSVMAVPVYSTLVVEANLFFRDSKVQLLKGPTPEMVPDGYVEAFIQGGSYDAQVSVAWFYPEEDEDFK